MNTFAITDETEESQREGILTHSVLSDHGLGHYLPFPGFLTGSCGGAKEELLELGRRVRD